MCVGRSELGEREGRFSRLGKGSGGDYRSLNDSRDYRSLGDSRGYRSLGDSRDYRSRGDCRATTQHASLPYVTCRLSAAALGGHRVCPGHARTPGPRGGIRAGGG